MDAFRLSRHVTEEERERRIERQILRERFTGAVFLAAGTCMTLIVLLLSAGKKP
ncbi:hypothetical protein [Actinomadura verrucosospora]|uniref:hypothetical protein n=1 Tax=Actinomadura verrucosospora TaxID=46165 RepID=UPI001564E895|nr:hypothetical protein [Actinomadura verrucosospora]